MSREIDQRLPPSDKYAERSILGAVLRDNPQFGIAAQEVQSSDFYSFAHQKIWETMLGLVAAGTPIDPVTLADELLRRGHMQDVGGEAYIVDLWDSAPAAANATYYGKIVRQKAILRALIHAAATISGEAFESTADANAVLSKAEGLVFDIARSGGTKTVTLAQAVDEAVAVLDRRAGKSADGEIEGGLLTGWNRFDKLTDGFHKRELIILAARPSKGKTLVALNAIESIAAERYGVFFASIEQGRVELVHRMLSRRAAINSFKFRTARFNDDEAQRLGDAIKTLRNYKVWINDGSTQSLSSIISETRRLKATGQLDLVVVDYLGLIDYEQDRATKTEQIGRITRGLKRLAKDVDIPVVCLAQLNRGSENRPNSKPRLADLRDSGEIEQDADTVLLLHKTEEENSERETDLLDVIIAKQRNGPCGEIAMVHHKKTFDVREMATY